MMNQSGSETSPWLDIAPLLNIAMAELGDKYHSAIVLRFFEGKELKQVGAELGVDERTAQTRVRRGVEKLRKFFVKRGITVSASVIAGAISANAVQAAPVGLVKSITAVCVYQWRDRFWFNLNPHQRSIENYGMDKSKNGNRGRRCRIPRSRNDNHGGIQNSCRFQPKRCHGGANRRHERIGISRSN